MSLPTNPSGGFEPSVDMSESHLASLDLAPEDLHPYHGEPSGSARGSCVAWRYTVTVSKEGASQQGHPLCPSNDSNPRQRRTHGRGLDVQGSQLNTTIIRKIITAEGIDWKKSNRTFVSNIDCQSNTHRGVILLLMVL